MIDPEVRSLTPQAIEADIDKYDRLLAKRAREQDVQAFLEEHSYFFNGILRLYAPSPLYSKVRLGSEYEMDFAWFDTASSGPDWRFVELEAPAYPMFTKAGEPSARLQHAMQQVRDWNAWIHRHLDYARALMPRIEYPLAYVFVGRRAQLTSQTRERLRRLAFENRSQVHLHTLDWFVGAARSVQGLLRPRGGGWPVPMRAFSHKDLTERRPSHAFDWLSQPDLEIDRASSREEREQAWKIGGEW